MSNYNPHRQPLNSWPNMLILGNQPKIAGQCRQNLRFIDQDSSNPRNRYRLRRAFGNQLFNTTTQIPNDYIVFTNTENNTFTIRILSSNSEQSEIASGVVNPLSYSFSVTVNQHNQISQFNRSKTEFIFQTTRNFDICANNLALGLSFNTPDVSLGEYIKSELLDGGLQVDGSFSKLLDITAATSVFIKYAQEPDTSNVLYYEIRGSPIIIPVKGQHPSDVTLSFSDNTGDFRSGLTPFRKAFNAGDMFTKNNSATSTLLPKPPNQVNSLRNMFGWQNNAGSVRREENGSFYSGNPKFVYDGSDYSRFKKLQAINRNYNDITFGGDLHSASQQAYRRVVQR